MKKNKGKLIVFEGVSGTGKETQAKKLSDFLRNKAIQNQIVFHPTPECKELLSAWRKTRSIGRMTEAYLLLADRHDRVEQVIVPALQRGEWIISLRSYISALVYQGKRDAERAWIKQEFLRFEPVPDKLFWFDIEPVRAMERILSRHKKTGETIGTFETPELLMKKRVQYRQVLTTVPYIHVDASLNIENIHESIVREIDAIL